MKSLLPVVLVLAFVVVALPNRPLADEFRIFDTFSTSASKRDRRPRWENLAQEMKNDSDLIGYVFFYTGRNNNRGLAIRYLTEARDILVKNRKISRGRLRLIDGGYRDQSEFVLYVEPSRAERLEPQPTLDSNDIIP